MANDPKAQFKQALASVSATPAETDAVEKVVEDEITRCVSRIDYYTQHIDMLTKQRDTAQAELAVAKSFAAKSGLPVPTTSAASAPPTLEDAKKAKIAELADRRWRAVTGGITFNGRRYTTDDHSQAAYVQAAFLADKVPKQLFLWKMEDGAHIFHTPEQIRDVAVAVGQHIQRQFNTEGLIYDAINAAKTIDAINAIDLVTPFLPTPPAPTATNP